MTIASDTVPQAIQIDHLLPAGEAWKRRHWTAKEFGVFFNDPDNLSITRARTNLRKGALLPDRWCPALRGARIASAVRYERVALRYRLPLSPQERGGLDLWKSGECATGARVLGGDR